jgi:hypothetical protein
MTFQPSHLSLPPGADYDGWFTNLFTREGRAENKIVRSRKKRQKAQEKAAKGRSGAASRLRRKADKLGVRSADLKEKAGVSKQIQGLTNDKNFAELWGSSYPWHKRPAKKGTKWTGGAKRMMMMAEGYRPDEKYINAEYRAVIAGGLTMLASAFNPETDIQTGQPTGYPPFNMVVNVDALPGMLRAKGKKQDENLLKVVKQCWEGDEIRKRYRKGEKPPRTLKTAADYVVKAVIERYIAKPAWAMRAMYLIGMAQERSRKGALAGKITGAVLATAGAAVVTVITAGIAAPAAGTATALLWGGIGAATAGAVAGGAASAKNAIQGAKLSSKHEIYRTTSMAALQEREGEIRSQQVDYEKIATEELARELDEVLRQRAEARALILRYALYGSLGIIGVAGSVKLVRTLV